jgi:hypothetical protein
LTTNISVQAINSSDFDEELLGDLYNLAKESVEEDYLHFRDHAVTNDLCHVFTESAGKQLAGFQFWRFQPECGVAHAALLWGGKLRFRPAFRGRGLHLLANILAEKQLREMLPSHKQKIYRIGLVNVFGFNSLAPGLHSIGTFPFTESDGDENMRSAIK